MASMGAAIELYLAREDSPHQSSAFHTWDVPRMMEADADWRPFAAFQLAKVKAINALGGPRLMLVWHATAT